jgi:hypothetical protein
VRGDAVTLIDEIDQFTVASMLDHESIAVMEEEGKKLIAKRGANTSGQS